MKKLLLTAILSSFIIGLSNAIDDSGYAENFISELKDQYVVEDSQREIRKLNRKLDNHFTFIAILHQDYTEELMMSLKSDIHPDIKSAKGRMIKKQINWSVNSQDLHPLIMKNSNPEKE